jgi:Na+-driven multidrug efflux pump
MLVQTLYLLVDLYFVGKLGKDAVAAVAVSATLTFLVLAASQMVGVATMALVAQASGRKDREGARLIFNQSQGLSAGGGGAVLPGGLGRARRLRTRPGSGIVFVSSSMFQALGNTLPALASSTIRLLLVGLPAYLLSRTSGFQLNWIWYLSVAGTLVQATCNLLLLRWQFAQKLGCLVVPAAVEAGVRG